jgi:hypothetical protein
MMTSPVRYCVTAETVGLRNRTNPGCCLIYRLTAGLRSMVAMIPSRRLMGEACRESSRSTA